MFSRIKNIFLLLLLILTLSNCNGESGPGYTVAVTDPTQTPVTTLEQKVVKIKDKELTIEIAETFQERQKGLMFRENLGENNGMLFIFSEPSRYSFWMKNTYIPLSIAFIKEDGTILQIEDMEPQTETPHTSDYMVKFAIEVNKGWFSRNNIKVGDKVYMEN